MILWDCERICGYWKHGSMMYMKQKYTFHCFVSCWMFSEKITSFSFNVMLGIVKIFIGHYPIFGLVNLFFISFFVLQWQPAGIKSKIRMKALLMWLVGRGRIRQICHHIKESNTKEFLYGPKKSPPSKGMSEGLSEQ